MTLEEAPIQGLYRTAAEGRHAETTLRLRGFSHVVSERLTHENTKLLPSNPVENKNSLSNAFNYTAIGILVGATTGLSAAWIAPIAGAIATLMGATMGGLIGIAIADRKPERYRQYIREGGILLTVYCPPGERVEVAEILRSTHATEIAIPTTDKQPEEGS